ncbi:MAG: LysM peptidoglycan-binding domain-containing protein [Ferruginibacter sp.]|nr:LysM peptidoglycan-binding domain-containing protein [Ferruginibacter sp.]
MKKIFLLLLILPFFATAQDRLMVEGISPALYIAHSVAPKENYYSIGRIYNVSPKDIAPFNKLEMEKGLTPGQKIKIPLNNSNFFQSGSAANDETFVPVYYKIKDKEGLYRVAKNNNDLPLETLKQWNGITGDMVKNGTQLVVGYLKVKTGLSALAKYGIGTSIGSAATVAVAEEKKAGEKKIAEPVAVDKPVSKKEDKKAAKKEAEKNKVQEETKVAPEPEKQVGPEPVKPARDKNVSESDFKKLYETQLGNTEPVAASGSAGIFKSTSGWSDKKYYCLHNTATPGTIIKITNTANGNIVFAKVLDVIPDIKMNEGLLIIISNAAADALGASEANFNCAVSYAK